MSAEFLWSVSVGVGENVHVIEQVIIMGSPAVTAVLSLGLEIVVCSQSEKNMTYSKRTVQLFTQSRRCESKVIFH